MWKIIFTLHLTIIPLYLLIIPLYFLLISLHLMITPLYLIVIIPLHLTYVPFLDKHYWTHGYVLKESRSDIMIFEDNFIEKIYACGKALNLLRQTNKCVRFKSKQYFYKSIRFHKQFMILRLHDLQISDE